MCVPSKSSLSAFKSPLSAFEEPAPAAIITVIIIIITIIFIIILSGFGSRTRHHHHHHRTPRTLTTSMAPRKAKRAAEASQASTPAKKGSAASGAPPAKAPSAPAAASGALPTPAASAPAPLTQVIDSENPEAVHYELWTRQLKTYVDYALLRFLAKHKRELSFDLPTNCSMIPPMATTQAASGANLSAFREVMDYDSLVASFSRTRQYEAAGTVWMLDPIRSDLDGFSLSALEGAMGLWSEDAFRRSSNHAPWRRLSFDVPLPVSVIDTNVAQRAEPGKSRVFVTEALPMVAGRAVVIAWYAAMCEALQESKEDRVWHLFNAALSVPIRMRVLPEGDANHLAAISFSETMFASGAASGADNC